MSIHIRTIYNQVLHETVGCCIYVCRSMLHVFGTFRRRDIFVYFPWKWRKCVWRPNETHSWDAKKRWERETLGNGKMVGWIENAVKSTELVDRKTRAYQILFSIIFKPEWPILGLSEKEKKINSGLIIVESLSSLSVSVMPSDLVCCIRCFISREKKEMIEWENMKKKHPVIFFNTQKIRK